MPMYNGGIGQAGAPGGAQSNAGGTPAGNMLAGMFGGGRGGFGGFGQGGTGGMSFNGQYMPGAPLSTPQNILSLREKCARGDGLACIQLQSAEQAFADQQARYGWEQQRNAFQARNAFRPMRAGGGW